MPDDRLAVAVAELYAAAPEDFTPRRGELAAAAREAGDRAAAKAIGALRRPTRAAWVVNTLARADPGAAPRLAGLAAALRDAQQAGDGRRLRELSVERDGVIDAFTARALAVAGVADAPPALRLELSQTLTAALADPDVAAEFAAGTLTRAMQWSGFGVLPAGADGDREPAEKAQFRSARSRSRDHDGRAPAAAAPAKAKRARATRTEPDAAARRQAEQAEHRRAEQAARRAEEAERRAREAAEQAAARRREQYEEAERTVASAASAATEAAAAEDRLEAEVRDLEQRLSQARTDLEAARLRARRAEGAERRARQALGRLPRG